MQRYLLHLFGFKMSTFLLCTAFGMGICLKEEHFHSVTMEDIDHRCSPIEEPRLE